MPDKYDVVRYPSFPRDQSHPAYIAALAAVAGLKTPPVGQWRVLEIGCGDASNILPLAVEYPNGQFVGVDRAAQPLNVGQTLALDLKLSNLDLICADLMDWKPGSEFDYIVAHGVFSWVPQEVRRKILQLCSESLKPAGIAFISYNALPGCHFRRYVRDLLRFHVRRDSDPVFRIGKARDFARFMTEMHGDEPLQNALRYEFNTLLERDETALYHDDLAEVNDPFYLMDFVGLAAEYGLQYLGDADPIRDDLQGHAPFAENWLEARQYMDFMTRRRFRETLLCRREISLDRYLRMESLKEMYIASRLTPGKLEDGDVQTFSFPKAGTLSTNNPIIREILLRLCSIWPASMPVSEFPLHDQDPKAIAELLMQLVRNKALDIRATPPQIADWVGERPQASALARIQVAQGYPMVTNQRHQNVELGDDRSRKLIALLDGTRDRTALLDELGSFGADRAEIAQMLENALIELHRCCLLTR